MAYFLLAAERPALLLMDPLWHRDPLAAGAAAGGMGVAYDDRAREYVLSAQTPGVRREDLRIEAVGVSGLEVTAAEPKTGSDNDNGEASPPGRTVLFRVRLPKDADASRARVQYSDGLLRVLVPRSTPDDAERRAKASDAAHADLAREYERRCARVRELRQRLEREAREADEAGDRLGEARALEARRIASERKALPFSRL